MMKRFAIVSALIGGLSLSGCIFVDDADDVWQASCVDRNLVGGWSGTNQFQTLRFSPSGDHLSLAVHTDQSPAVALISNLQVRTACLLGQDMLMLRDFWGSWRHAMAHGAIMTTNPIPEHLVHGYLLIPYRVQDDMLVFNVSDSQAIEELIRSKQVAGFLRKPPPARDLTPPILTRLDPKTTAALQALASQGNLLGREQTYNRSEQHGGSISSEGATSAPPNASSQRRILKD